MQTFVNSSCDSLGILFLEFLKNLPEHFANCFMVILAIFFYLVQKKYIVRYKKKRKIEANLYNLSVKRYLKNVTTIGTKRTSSQNIY